MKNFKKPDLNKIKENVEEIRNSVIWLCKEEEKNKLFNYEDFFWVWNTELPESIKYYDWKVEYNQWTTSRCTAYAWTCVSNHTQKKDIWQFPFFDPDKVWKLQTEVYPKTWSESRWDYLIAPFQLFQKIGVEWESPSWNYVYKIQYYYYISIKSIEAVKDALFRFWPLWFWWRFNSSIFNNVKKYWYMDLMLSDTWASTFWHALSLIWYNKEWFLVQDSYKWRNYNIFTIKYDAWLKGSNDWTLFPNVIVPVDILDKDKFSEELQAKLFDDVWLGMKQNEPEIYDAIKFTKENWIFKWSNWKFHPDEPLSRKHMAVVLKRFYDKFVTHLN